MPLDLGPDATLRDLQSAPQERETFLRRALKVMGTERKDHGVVALRLGVTGTGQRPNYRIEDKAGAVIVAIDGNNHQPWPDSASATSALNWSTATMSYEDVQDTLAALTGYKKPKLASAAR